jgi:hypothetical protein
LRAIVDEYFAREGNALRSATARRSTFDRLVLPVLGDRPICDVRRSEIVRLLDDIEDNNGPGAARVTSAYLGKVMNWDLRKLASLVAVFVFPAVAHHIQSDL